MLRWKDLRFAALALALVLPAALGPGHALAAVKAPAAKSTAKSKANLRQFTGYVTALDKESITVEKRGNAPRTLVFSRNAELRTVGDVEKDARVTVYYRDDDGQLTAHRVVAKTPKASGGGATSTKARGESRAGGR
jgi:YD repeat-containing protein